MAVDRDGDGPQLRKAETKPDDATTLRATPFTEDVFDEEYYRGRGRSSGNSSIGLIVGVVFGAVLAGGAAWVFLTGQGGPAATTNGAGVPVIKADSSPMKIKPETPGGMQVENQDKTVYDRVAKTDAPNRVENLLPPPEQPKAPPKVEPKPAPKPAEPVAEVRSPLDEKRDELAAMIANLDKKPAERDKLAIVESNAPTADPRSPAKPLVPNPPAPLPESTAVAATPTTPAPVPATAPAAAPSAALAGHLVQLAAAKSEEGAMAEWNRIKTKHTALVGALTPTVVRADLGERGVFYRLRAGSLPDKAAADALCAALTAQGDACLVVKP